MGGADLTWAGLPSVFKNIVYKGMNSSMVESNPQSLFVLCHSVGYRAPFQRPTLAINLIKQ